MIFCNIVQSFIVGVILLIFLISPIMDESWVSTIQSRPIFPKKYHKHYYCFLFFIYLCAIGYFWKNRNFEYVTGLSFLIILWCFFVLAKSYSSRKANSPRVSVVKDELPGNDVPDFFECNLVLVAIFCWFIIWLGSFLKWEGYSYYAFMKFSAVIISWCMAEISYEFSKVFFILFVITAIAFNPIIPFRLEREIWQLIDMFTLIILFSFYIKIKRYVKNSN